MHASTRSALLCAFVAFATLSRLFAAETVALASAQGAVATFTASDSGWRWTGLTTPGAPEPIAIDELGYQIVSGSAQDLAAVAAGWTLTANESGRLVFEHEFPAVGIRLRRVFSFGPADNVLRMETWAMRAGEAAELSRLSLLSAQVHGEKFQATGLAGQSFPLFGSRLFVGIEHVSGECYTWDEVAWAGQTPHLPLGPDWTLVAAVVIGWPVPGADLAPGESPMREAFLHYLDTVRVKPAGLELHTNTWWTLPLPFSEADVLRDLEALKAGFYDRTGMFFDSYALDLGWSDRHSVWQVDAQRFPNGFTTIEERLAQLGCRLGLWLSPGSAYPEGLDNTWLAAQGYEMTPSSLGGTGAVACFARGNRYQQAVKDRIVGYAQQYRLGHVKLDFMARTCAEPTHGHATDPMGSGYAIDAGLADVLDRLRAVNPTMALEPLVCGTPPSPWWAMHTPFVLGPDGDDVPWGRVAAPEWIEALITARDVAYRARQTDWLMRTQSLETFDIVVQCPGDFENMAVLAIGRGRWFISTYLKPDYLKPADWDFLAALVRWARANQAYLGDAQPIGGKPELKQAYGYVLHTPDKDIYCLRNPWMEPRTLQLPVSANVTATRDLQMLYPRRATLARVVPGTAAPKVTLAPYETVMLETVPTNPKQKLAATPNWPKPTVVSSGGQWTTEANGTSHYVWDGTVTIAAVNDPELCLLAQGTAAVKDATAAVTIDGGAVEAAKSGSAGQFAAATTPPVENWTWFRTPVAPGTHTLHVEITIPLRSATIGVYLRGTTNVASDPVPTAGAPFPVFHPTLRAWSATLASLKAYTTKAAVTAKPAATR